MQQLEQGHMDDNLAVLYQDMLNIGLVNEELAHSLSRIIFMNKLIVFEPNLVRAIIYQEQMKNPQIVPIVNRTAYFQLFSKDYVILFEDERGRRFVGSVSYRLQKLMEVESYIEKCMELAPDEITTTPITNPPFSLAAFATHSIKPRLAPPYTNVFLFCPIHLPNS